MGEGNSEPMTTGIVGTSGFWQGGLPPSNLCSYRAGGEKGGKPGNGQGSTFSRHSLSLRAGFFMMGATGASPSGAGSRGICWEQGHRGAALAGRPGSSSQALRGVRVRLNRHVSFQAPGPTGVSVVREAGLAIFTTPTRPLYWKVQLQAKCQGLVAS